MDCYQREKARTAGGGDGRSRTWIACFFALAVLGLLAVAGSASAQDDCQESGKNIECNAFGRIAMENRERVKGEPVDVNASITLNTSYEDQGARWIMFSIRNVTDRGPSPVSVQLNTFSTDEGEIVTTRVDHEQENELNLWVDVLDLPVGEEITLDVTVGCTEEGAYAVETLVLAFDRGYDPIKNASGENVGLFSYTLLGVNEATEAVSAANGDEPLGIRGVPGPTSLAAAGSVTIAAAALAGGRER